MGSKGNFREDCKGDFKGMHSLLSKFTKICKKVRWIVVVGGWRVIGLELEKW